MNNMGDAFLKVGFFNEEEAEKVRRTQAIEAFWENPSPENLRQLDLVPERLRAAVPIESFSQRRHEDVIYVRIERVDLKSTFYDTWRDAMRSTNIMWTDESGTVHEKHLTLEDEGKTLGEIVDCVPVHVLTIQRVAYERGRRRNMSLIQNYDIGLYLS